MSVGCILTAKGEVKKCKILDNSMESIQTILKKKTQPQVLGNYPYGSIQLTLIGYKEGRAGSENKHELPPPLDEVLFFGDIVVVASKANEDWQSPINFTPEQYEKFYNKQFGGFDDIDSEDSETEDELIEEEKEEEEKEEKEEEIDDEEDAAEDTEEDEVLEDDEEIVAPKKVSKKKAQKANLTVQSNTGRAKQQELLQKKQLEQLPISDENVRHKIPDDDSNENKIRTHYLELLQKSFKRTLKQSILVELEQVVLYHALVEADKKFIFRHFENPLFILLYKTAARTLLGNLQPGSYIGNQSLFQKLKSGQLTVDNLRSMTVIDYAPYLYSTLREKQLLREQNQLEGNKALATDRFFCSRCHKRECTYYELQTRSADEPMTIFISCVNCGKRWKQ